MTAARIVQGVIAAALLTSLAACDDGMGEVKQWMAEQKSQARVTVPKLSEPKKFVPYSYTDQDQVDPFNQSKLTIALAKASAAPRGPFAPDPNRKHEPLESFPLDSITMVGTINKGGPHAVLQVDKTLYNVKVGNHLGQNDGEIKAINDSGMEISERVQDASGEWVERKTTLELQETKK